jgi:hypothetical protein
LTELLVLILRSIKFGKHALAWVPRSIKFGLEDSTDDDPEKSARPTWARSRITALTIVLESCTGGPCGGSSSSLSIQTPAVSSFSYGFISFIRELRYQPPHSTAFHVSSHYDTAIFNYFNSDETIYKESIENGQILRYGENPHQKGFFFGDFDAMFQKIHGKELSYNNLLDVDAAVNLILEFKSDAPTFAILKHNNAC